MLIPIALGAVAIANRERIWKLLGAKGLTNYDRQQAVLAKRPIFPTLESIQKGYPVQESIDYREEEDGKPIVHLNLDCHVYRRDYLEDDAWGVTVCESNTTPPPKFDAKAEEVKVEIDGQEKTCARIKECKLFMKLMVICREYADPKWKTWSAWMDARVGRGTLTQPERVLWTYMHEMDHFQVYHEYWRFMAKHILVLTNSRFPTVVEAENAIVNIRKNLVCNYLVTKQRSAAFDQSERGLPQAGSRFSTFPFNERERLEWHPQTKWPAGSITDSGDNYYENRILEIPEIDPIEGWMERQMKKPGGLLELQQLMETRKFSQQFGSW